MIDNALIATLPQDEDDSNAYKEVPKHPIMRYAENLILHDLGNITDCEKESGGENCNRIIHILKKFPLKKMTPEAEAIFVEDLGLRRFSWILKRKYLKKKGILSLLHSKVYIPEFLGSWWLSFLISEL